MKLTDSQARVLRDDRLYSILDYSHLLVKKYGIAGTVDIINQEVYRDIEEYKEPRLLPKWL